MFVEIRLGLTQPSAENEPSTGQPPHPQPFSPGKTRGRREPEGYNITERHCQRERNVSGSRHFSR
jgi:hypothetical protein